MATKRPRRAHGQYKPFYLRINPKNPDALTLLLKNYPCFITHMIDDLLNVEGLSEVEIGFGSSISLEVIRDLTAGNLNNINQEVSLALLGLYARVFCNWWCYRDD